MENVDVSKTQLLEQLTTNRQKHLDDYTEAHAKYREKAISELEKWLRHAVDGGRIAKSLDLQEPVSHLADYDRAIQMVEWSTGDTVELSERDFQQYVMDDWGWKAIFAATNSSYGVGG